MSSERYLDLESRTYRSHGISHLKRLCESVGLGEKTGAICRLFSKMITPWGDTPIGAQPLWPSEIGDDHSPYEFSVSFGGTPELRILVEALGSPPSLASNREAALALTDLLVSECEADRRRFDAIADLFLPEDLQGNFAIWHAVSFWPNRPPEMKLYLDPQARGRNKAASLIEEALVRLGLPKAYSHIARTAGARGPYLDEYKYISIDLAAHEAARVKVYVRHHHPSFADLEYAASAAASYRPGEISSFAREITGLEGDVFDGRSLATCHNFLVGSGDRPAVATTHIPVSYVANDEIAAARIASALGKLGLPVETYRNALAASSWRSPEAGIGLQSYASYKRNGEKPKVTIYFPPELWGGTPPEVRPAGQAANAAQLLERLTTEPITEHPLFHRMNGDSNPVATYALVRNLAIGLIDDKSVGLADDFQVDLVEGAPAKQAYQQRFQTMLAELARTCGGDDGEAQIAPGLRLRKQLTQLYAAKDETERSGARLVVDIMARQIDLWISAELRWQRTFERPDETSERVDAEIHHEAVLAQVTDDAIVPLSRGVDAAVHALWVFCDGLYEILPLAKRSNAQRLWSSTDLEHQRDIQ